MPGARRPSHSWDRELTHKHSLTHVTSEPSGRTNHSLNVGKGVDGEKVLAPINLLDRFSNVLTSGHRRPLLQSPFLATGVPKTTREQTDSTSQVRSGRRLLPKTRPSLHRHSPASWNIWTWEPLMVSRVSTGQHWLQDGYSRLMCQLSSRREVEDFHYIWKPRCSYLI